MKGGGHVSPLQYSCLENPMDRGAWQAMVHRVAKSWTWLKQLSTHACISKNHHSLRYKGLGLQPMNFGWR